jgi:N-acyl-D-aspartate/D-glutamate deacylase
MGEGGKLSRSVASVAGERGVHPVEAMIDLGLESDFGVFFFQPTSNDDPADVKVILDHPRTVMTFSDAGAHVSQIMNASLPTHLLGVWVRERQAFTLEHAVRMLTLVPSTIWGFADRGLVREGFVADLNVFDPEAVGECLPQVAFDLPSGAARLTQRATGFLATVVNGRVLLDRGEHTGELPGSVVRRGRASRPPE